MARKQRQGREWDDYQKLKAENKKLKGQVSKLRKVISRLDFEQYTNLKELIDSHERQDSALVEQQKKQELENKWNCYECGSGVMRLVIIHRAGEPYYIRKCDHCDNKTKMKKYTDEVEGV